ncbi:phosphonate ABC transporter ATP-binding protein [Cupriavidus oxalaticus]|jgi:phosphonate transport system ATP-binding protein|uniref:Phosphonate ABC transporter ATP-binding protein n=1 Tax=Cupriavidus oxalaticus TaxID=96344 RepID=A0A375G0D8_9BURK|nr:phosphonate ABC transporter ATP-binding protein [Cupriavidus oxalaticus]QEZ46491.1 phosphonate ABC transporter ATP-binding protein [Cupriavidus oxalaticus]QRQ86038.1 phosphonate ABC transporter ATP-binding protein [Cupriavidus oxalaticus]QRQ95635.1 phosphonate ABC transporter ATP-binding protein [Cupriavidus oxalaticus]WQD84298.1 phosphonate ABC transporter ATP-binding protein [Cupriavidus oxalaticus]SPC05517.1 phosphonate/organophosphate ester transporter subunit; ATP-binding component of 
MTHTIEVRGLSKSFRADRKALDEVTLRVAPGEMVALLGASGSGKSTLLRHMAGFVTADAGEILVNGRPVQRNGRLARNVRHVRGEIGFVFQQFNLVGRLPVITNVLVGMLARIPKWRSLFRIFKADELRAGLDALAQVGIDDYAFQRASTLSGGQQQRAAIARTLVQNARVILADEPIASLDPESSRRVMSLLAQINRTRKVAVVVSLHQVDVALRYCPRVVALRHGKVVYDGPSAALTPAMLRDLYGTEADELLHDAATDADEPAAAMPAPAMVTMNLAAA